MNNREGRIIKHSLLSCFFPVFLLFMSEMFKSSLISRNVQFNFTLKETFILNILFTFFTNM